MIRIESKYSELYSKANLFIFFLLLLFPVMPTHLMSIIIGFVTGFYIFGLLFKSTNDIEIRFEKPWIITALLVVLLLSFLYTQNIHEGLFQIEKRGVLFIFPLIFFLRKNAISKKIRFSTEMIFVLIIFLFFTYLNIKMIFDLYKAIGKGLLQGSPLQIVTSQDFYYIYRSYFEKKSNIHPTYASIFSLFSLGVIILNFLNGEFKKYGKIKIFLVFVAGLLFIYSLILASKGPLLAFFISVLLILFFKLKKKQFLIVSTGLILIFIISVFSVPTIKNRISEVFTNNKNEEISSVSLRKIVVKSSWELIQQNWLTGVGVGDVQDHLNKIYKSYSIDKLNNTPLNTHNEYFNVWLSAGLLGLVVFLIILILPLISSLKQKDFNFLFFLVFFAIIFLFENILSRQKGALFFTLFYLTYYYFQIDYRKCLHDIRST